MSIGAGVSLGGNLSLCGMSSCFTPLSSPAAPSDSCTGGGSCTGGNGSSSGSGGSNLPADGSGSCCSQGGGNGNGMGSQTGTYLGSPGGSGNGNSQCCSDGNGDGTGSQTGTFLGSPGSGGSGSGSQCCSDNSNGGSGGGNAGGATYLGNGDSSCPPPSGPTPACVRPQTRIALFPEGCQAAGELQVGDVVLTRTPEGELVGEAVAAVRRSVQPCLALTIEDGRRLLCSESHEVMVADAQQAQGIRTRVSSLTLADRLLCEDGTPVRLVVIEPQPAGEVIQISLAGPHHVYLSEGLWSHNKEQGWPPSFPSPGS